MPGYEASQIYGIAAAKNTPPDIIARLNKELNAILADPAAKARLNDLGVGPLGGSPAQFAKVIAEDTERWGKVVKFSGAKVD